MRQGQVMVLTVLAIGGTLLAATTVAGVLMVYQIRQATDIANSAKALAAADTGLEWGFYQFFKPSSTKPMPVLGNGATFTTVCVTASSTQVPCTSDDAAMIRATGHAANVTRALEIHL